MPLRIGSCLCSAMQEHTHRGPAFKRVGGGSVGKIETGTKSHIRAVQTTSLNTHSHVHTK